LKHTKAIIAVADMCGHSRVLVALKVDRFKSCVVCFNIA